MQNRFNGETTAADAGLAFTRRTLLVGAGGIAAAAWLAPGLANAAPVTVATLDGSNGQLRLDLTTPDLRGLDAWTVTTARGGTTTSGTPTALQRLNGGRTILLDFEPVEADGHSRPITIRVTGASGRVTTTTVVHPDVAIATDGATTAVVVVPAPADPVVAAAAERLVDFVAQATGARLPIVPTGDPRLDEEFDSHWPIHVGTVPATARQLITTALSELADQGYVINTDQQATTLLGNTPLATEYAVDDFLERYAGVRWLMPGDFGTHVPALTTMTLPRQLLIRQPAIASRVPHPLHTAGRNERTEVNYVLGQRLHVNPSIEGYSHNLWQIFLPRAGKPSQDWGTTHPEFYPVRNGKVDVPTGQTRWQPQFTEPGTVQVTVDFILAHFEEHPEATSFSLAVNDGGGFAEAEPDHPANPHRTNSFGYPDLSDIYYAWVNQVATAVAEVHPDKWLGLLAYREVADPPSFPLHDQVVPYLTKERLTWLDPEIETHGKALTASWRARANHVAFYDYAYGARYMAPRIYPHHMADYLRYGVDTGLAAYFGETDVTWGEGPKVYSIAKLLWNPHQDVDRLLDDWYRHAVGNDAAPYLKQYFDHWEEFWTTRIPTTDWFQTRKTITYLSFYLQTYLTAVTPDDIAQCQQLLDAAEARTQTDDQRARLGVITEAFAYYKASALSYPHDVADPGSEAAAIALADELESRITASVEYAADRIERYEGWFDNFPLLWPQQHLTQLNAEWSGLQPDLAWTLIDHVRTHEPSGGPVTDRLVQVAGSATDVSAPYAALILNGARNLLVNRNPSFEAGTDVPEVWQTNIRRAGDTFRRVTDPQSAHTGTASVLLEEFLVGDLQQTVQVKPGILMLRAHYHVSSDYDGVGDTWLWFDLLDDHGQVLRSAKSQRQPYSATRGEWTDIMMAEPVPTEIDGTTVVAARIGIHVNGFQEGGRQHIDDVEVVQSAETTPSTAAVMEVEADATEVRVTLDSTPDHAPARADFELTRSHNASSAEILTPTAFSWDAKSRTAILTVAAIPDSVLAATPFEDHIAVGASFRGGRPVFAHPYLVPGEQPPANQLTVNPSFDQWPDPLLAPTGWTLWRGSRMGRSTEARTGPYALRTTGFTAAENSSGGGGPRQLGQPITPGHYLAVMRAKAASTTSGFVRWRIGLRDSAGTVIKSLTADMVPAGSSHGEWLPVVFDVTIEQAYGGKVPVTADFYLMFKDVEVNSEILLDDIGFHLVD